MFFKEGLYLGLIEKCKKWLTVSPPYILLLLIIYLLYYVATVFASLESPLEAAIIAAVATGLVAIYTQYIQRNRELNFKIREKKIEAYQNIFDFFSNMMRDIKENGEADADKMVDAIRKINYGLVIWGSESIVVAWYQFFTRIRSMNSDNIDNTIINAMIFRNKVADIFLLIRRDMGHNDKIIDFNMVAELYMPINFTDADFKAIDDALDRARSPQEHS